MPALRRVKSLLIRLVILGAALASSPGWADKPQAETVTPVMDSAGVKPRPNILWIMADQLRYDCVGANGS